MISKWTQHLKDQSEKDDFEKFLRNSKIILDRLDQMFSEEISAAEDADVSIKSFDSPNWAEKQAYRNGYKASLKLLKTIIDLDHQKGIK